MHLLDPGRIYWGGVLPEPPGGLGEELRCCVPSLLLELEGLGLLGMRRLQRAAGREAPSWAERRASREYLSGAVPAKERLCNMGGGWWTASAARFREPETEDGCPEALGAGYGEVGEPASAAGDPLLQGWFPRLRRPAGPRVPADMQRGAEEVGGKECRRFLFFSRARLKLGAPLALCLGGGGGCAGRCGGAARRMGRAADSEQTAAAAERLAMIGTDQTAVKDRWVSRVFQTCSVSVFKKTPRVVRLSRQRE